MLNRKSMILIGLLLSVLLVACNHGTNQSNTLTTTSQNSGKSQATNPTAVSGGNNNSASDKKNSNNYGQEDKNNKDTISNQNVETKPDTVAKQSVSNVGSTATIISGTTSQPAASTSQQQHQTLSTKSADQQQTVSIMIAGDNEHGVILPMQSVPVQDGDTVLDVLARVLKAKHMQMEYSGMKSTAYVKGIDNLYEFDDGPKSGWMFKVDGKFGDKSAGSIQVKPGDTIEWLYTIDLGKDIGA